VARILAFSGSTRRASLNRKLIRIAAEGARLAGGEVMLVDLDDYPMPIYNGDLEAAEGLPEPSRDFKQLLRAHDGILISSPEYNGSISPLLKNTLDWASRAEDADGGPLAAYRGKVAAIMSASPGAFGGARGLIHLRQLLTNLGVMVLPDQQAVRQAGTAFDEDGALVDEQRQKKVEQCGAELVRVVDRLLG